MSAVLPRHPPRRGWPYYVNPATTSARCHRCGKPAFVGISDGQRLHWLCAKHAPSDL